MDGNELIARILEREGVEWIACFPNNPLIEAAARIGIRPIAFRHERGAVMAADGYSRTSDRERFGVVAVQSQAGAENALGGIAQANADNIPILVLPGGPSSSQVAVRPNYSAVRNYEGVCKSAESIRRPPDIVAAMRRAFAALRNGAAGPVVVELTADVCQEEVPEGSLADYVPPPAARQAPDPVAVDGCCRCASRRREPVLWAGGGALFGRAATELRELAELTATPVFTTRQGKSVFDESHPLSLGAGGMTTTGPAAEWLARADLVLAIGFQPHSDAVRTECPDRLHGCAEHRQPRRDRQGRERRYRASRRCETHSAGTRRGSGVGGRTRPKDSTGIAARVVAARESWLARWAPALTSDELPPQATTGSSTS